MFTVLVSKLCHGKYKHYLALVSVNKALLHVKAKGKAKYLFQEVKEDRYMCVPQGCSLMSGKAV